MDGILGALPQAQPQGQPPQMPGQAPGQMPMPGMQPRPAGPAPGINAQAPMLERMGLDQLKQLYMQSMMPGSGIPVQPFAILSAISKKAEQEKAMQAVRNATAMGQNAQQGPGSVAQQVLQEADQVQQPVMAAHGGMMRGYAGGGIVAFQSGTSQRGLPYAAKPSPVSSLPSVTSIDLSTPPLISSMGADPSEDEAKQNLRRLQEQEKALADQLSKFGLIQRQSNPEQFNSLLQSKKAIEEQRELAERIYDASKWKAQKAWESSLGPVPAAQAGPLPPAAAAAMKAEPPPANVPDFGDDLERIKRRSLATPASAAPVNRGITAAPGATVKQSPPATTPPGARPVAAQSTAPNLADDQELQNYLSSLRTRQGVPEDVAAGRAGLEALVAAEMKSRQERLAQDRASAEERRKEALERAPGVFSPEGLLAIAASIDPRRGYELGSAARGAFGVMGAQRKAQEEARKEFREFEKAERTEQNLLSQMSILEAQRKLAILDGDAKTANEITDKIYATRRDIEKFNAERAEKARDADIRAAAVEAEREKARATREGTAATRDATQFARLSQTYGAQRASLVDDLRLETEKHREQNKMIYAAAQLGMDKMTPEQQKEYARVENELKGKLDKIRSDYAILMGPIGEKLGLGLPSGVKVKKTGP